MNRARTVSILASILGAICAYGFTDSLGLDGLSPLGLLVNTVAWIIVWQWGKRTALDWLEE